MKTVCKFGGTSLAGSENVARCRDIVMADTARRIVVVSAPGKKKDGDIKVTDLLHECYLKRFDLPAFSAVFAKIEETFREIASPLKNFPVGEELCIVRAQICQPEANEDFVLSRGEYLNAKLVAAYLGYAFLDAAAFIRFKGGELDLSATLSLAAHIETEKGVVIPGFYGLDEEGHVKTFSRGGSDITGAIAARAFGCNLYENWTDVNGIRICDPKIVPNSKKVSEASYRELREMSYMGASVLHAETLLPLVGAPVPIVIRNSFRPDLAGTMIRKKRTDAAEKENIACITGKSDYTCIQISKMLLDKQLGFVKKVTSVFEEYNINISHTHSGLDNLCFFVERAEYIKISFENFVKELKRRIDADKIRAHGDIALVAVIGHGLSGRIGVLADIFNALKDAGIGVKTIYQSISECNVIVGIENVRLADAVRALYAALIR